MNESVAVIGLGYIGLPTSAIIASSGIPVIGVDINPDVVDTINAGKIHIVEPELESIVSRVIREKLLVAQTHPVSAGTYLIVVPTPFRQNYQPNIAYIEAAVLSIIPFLKEGDLCIIESTSPVGTTEKMAALIWEKRPELKGKLSIAYCPERVLPGNVVYELVHNDRVIGGIDSASTEKAIAFYRRFVQGQLYPTNARTAEMCKLTENSCRDVQIAFANELSMICDEAGIDVWELIHLANKHPRVNILQPGCGVGGHCIAVDPWFIVSDYPERAQIIKRARETNDYKADWCVNKILEQGAAFVKNMKREPIVACMGLAFKPNIDDLRESPAKHIASRVIAESGFDVLVVEPNITSHKSFLLTEGQKAYDQADIVVWLVNHRDFSTIIRNEKKIELDFCGISKK